MDRRMLTASASLLTILGVLAGLALGTTLSDAAVISPARSVSIPATPHILYLAPPGARRGLLTETVVIAHGGIPVRRWDEARQAARLRALDALLIDSAFIAIATPYDQKWLQAQYREGVVMVGLGVDDDQFAESLGLVTFRVAGEATVPIGPVGYRLTYSLALGQPEDLAGFGYRVEPAIQEDYGPAGKAEHYAVVSSGMSRGDLSTEAAINPLFFEIVDIIKSNYEMRAEFATHIVK